QLLQTSRAPAVAGRPREARHPVLWGGVQSGDADVEVLPRLVTTEIDLVHAAAVGGICLALMLAFQCIDDLRSHRLERVLREWEAPRTPVSAFDRSLL